MIKITTELCKEFIIEFVRNNREFIANEFYPPLIPDDVLEKAGKAKHWKRMYKSKDEEENTIERGFDCISFDSQLRGYVITNIEDTQVLEIYVQGE
jgi:hypothetical protein